jgi:S1-C subfamily serine protease
MNKTIDQTNFLVNGGCSGTLIDVKNRYILTAEHCVSDQYETVDYEKIDEEGIVKKEKRRRLREGTVAQIAFNGGSSTVHTTYTVKLKAFDKANDLALLQVIAELPSATAAKLACVEPVRGDTIYIVGNPAAINYASVTKGLVSSLQRDYKLLRADDDPMVSNAKQPLMQISGGVVGGNSGGSVFNTSGELVGVPVRANRMNEVLGYAVPLHIIKSFLTREGVDASTHCKETN